MALSGKANSKGGSGGDFELLDADTYEARLVAIIDLGVHEESFQGGDPKKQHKVLFVWELTGVTRGNGKPWYVNRRYTLSFHEKASLRKDLEAHQRKPYPEGADIDPEKFLGLPWSVEIAHSKKGEKTYFAVGKVGPVAKARAASVPEPTVEPFVYEIGGPAEGAAALKDALSWLPYVYGEKVEDLVKQGRRNMALAGVDAGGEASPDDDPDSPF
jgi:hypothetical protein